MSDSEIMLFRHEQFGEIRTLNIDGEPWFVGKDITSVLGYSNSSKALIDHVDEEDKLNNVSLSSLGQRGGWLINESGLYSLILSSKLPSAKAFKHWVTAEVLPSIRRNGAYLTAEMLHKTMSDPRELAKLLNTLADEQEKRQKLEEENAFLTVKARYYDQILNSKNAVPVTQIAKDYRMSAVAFNKLLPDQRVQQAEEEAEEGDRGNLHRVEAVLGARFPGINKTLGEFNFTRHYGAIVKEVKSGGQRFTRDLDKVMLHEGDTLVLWADDSFIPTWGESSVFLLLANGSDPDEPISKKKRWLALSLLIFMIVGATVGELPFVKERITSIRLDMFFFVSITTIIMAWTKIFPPKKYTKYISWDILITIACAFAISKAMENSGFAALIARHIISMADSFSPYALLAIIFIITNIFTELITNNAAAALSFPIALSVATQLGVDPTPFFVVICMAASASFATPIGYQTNLIVQGVGGYKFTDFVKVGLPLNLITFLISVFVIPLIWKF